MTKLYRITTYLGDEQLGAPIYLTDSETDQRWWEHFKVGAPTRRVFEVFELVSTEEIPANERP